ncbi:ankyrin repeat domain-containing protein [Alteromonas sp. 5E99-2]|uniref:ankyrin repeat domain-containing protein n=1 Tax=Alteromonas sp. 5E99-2 TaxID=2817683 RepID=UPI001A990E34|nr:ankyrin repeat domain-containing protein [Alteromonas sp. 5E99-2]MBO1256062.1 ankyrin repeat domain-containing protein [Alteromonas sp. 5E99-2]
MKALVTKSLKILALFILVSATFTGHAQTNEDALQTLYFDAARQGDIPTLSAFYDAGLSPDVTDKKGYSALILAAYHGETEAVNYLLKQTDANPCQKDNSGNTALMGAIFKGNFGAIKALIQADCDVDQKNENGQTAAMFATLFNRTETLNELSQAGANLGTKDASGNNLVDIALSQGNYELAEKLTPYVEGPQ